MHSTPAPFSSELPDHMNDPQYRRAELPNYQAGLKAEFSPMPNTIRPLCLAGTPCGAPCGVTPRFLATESFPPCGNGAGIVNHPISQGKFNTPTDASTGGAQSAYRTGRRNNDRITPDGADTYYNPYEYGTRQNELGLIYQQPYIGPYADNPAHLCELGVVGYDETFPGLIRNVNMESSLLQREMTHTPGQRANTDVEINRFNLLPFDPQDTRHIVWKDNMPRGGYPSRADRLELV